MSSEKFKSAATSRFSSRAIGFPAIRKFQRYDIQDVVKMQFNLILLLDLHTRFFGPIDKIVDMNNVSDSTRLISFYTSLLRQWVLMHVSPEHHTALPIGVEDNVIHYMRHVGSLVVKALQV